LPEGFAWKGTIVWVPDPGTGIILPFWLGPRFSSLLDGLQPGDAAPADLPLDVFSVAENGYVPVGSLIHPYHLAALRRYYRYLIRHGEMQANPALYPHRYGAHNEPVARFFHLQLTDAVAAIAGEDLKPSYVYSTCYQSGGELSTHTDREQCVFTISLCLDFAPEPVRQTPWPLGLDARAAKVSVYQAIGDGLLFRGQELPHYRDPLTKGNTSTSLLFHYVPADFSGSPD
jgi:hypothetical protein